VTRPIRSLLLTAAALLPLGAAVVWAASAPWSSVTATAVSGDGVLEIPVRVHAWGFSPRVIHVAPGQTVRFVASSDDIGHGFAINELGVNVPLRAGVPMRSSTVTVNLPDGVYEIHCSVFCGLGHPAMKGRLVVGVPRRHFVSMAPWLASLAVGLAAAGVVALTLRRSRPQ
jgi:heme/copper-type cytochrome/quinol oxidase subunit 2